MKLEIKEFEVNREYSYRAYNPKIDDKLLKIISNGINKYFDAVIKLFNTSKEDKEKYTDNLSNLFYFMYDEKDLLNILSLYTKKKLNKIDLIKTDMFGYINGKEYNVNYEIAITKNADKSTINDSDIKIYLEKENSGSYSKVFGPSKFKGISKTSDLGTPKGSMVLAKVTNKKSIIENYRLKVWLSNTASPGTVPQNYSLDINLVGDAE